MANEGDFVISLSSELISQVMDRYFNEHMFRQDVSIVDLSPLENGYAFTLAINTTIVGNDVVTLKPGNIEELKTQDRKVVNKPKSRGKR